MKMRATTARMARQRTQHQKSFQL
uniref:Uncharacterized protein n=1 Tax=Arundo donax TaxID=35708 RepID=A0A0A8ZKG1_ARUDO